MKILLAIILSAPFLLLLSSQCEKFIQEDTTNQKFALLQNDGYGWLKVTDMVQIGLSITQEMKELPDIREISFPIKLSDCQGTILVKVAGIPLKESLNFPFSIPFEINDSTCFGNNGKLKITYHSFKEFTLKSEPTYRLFSKLTSYLIRVKQIEDDFVRNTLNYTITYTYSFLENPSSLIQVQGNLDLQRVTQRNNNTLRDDTFIYSGSATGKNLLDQTIRMEIDPTIKLERTLFNPYFLSGKIEQKLILLGNINYLTMGRSSSLELALYEVEGEERTLSFKPDF